MLLSEGFWMLLDASAAPASCLLPPCPLVAASYELVLQSISSPAVSITTQLGQEELPVSSIQDARDYLLPYPNGSTALAAGIPQPDKMGTNPQLCCTHSPQP